MNTISIPENEFRQLKQLVEEIQFKFAELEKLLAFLKNSIVRQTNPEIEKLEKPLPLMYIERTGEPIPCEFGAGKHLIEYMADDFTAPLDDFKDYI